MLRIIKLVVLVLSIGLLCRVFYELGMRAGYVVSCSNEILQMLITILSKGSV